MCEGVKAVSRFKEFFIFKLHEQVLFFYNNRERCKKINQYKNGYA